MPNKVQVKRSAVAGKIPTISDLDLGEIGVNTYDGKMFFKKNDGSQSIITISNEGHSHTTFVYNTGNETIAGIKTFSNQILASSGTLSLPGFAFSGDTNTGLYRVDGDNFGLVQNGVERLRVGTGGISITGTLSTTEKLTLPTSTTTRAPLNIPHGTAPTTPVHGDIWTTTSAVQVNLNGTTRSLAHTASWSAMSLAEGQTGTATTSRFIQASVLKDLIQYHATGLTHFVESRNNSAPNTTIPVHQIEPNGSEPTIDIVIAPKGHDGSILAQVPDNTTTGGNPRGRWCIDLQRWRWSAGDVVASDCEWSAIYSGYANKIKKAHFSTIIGGQGNIIEDPSNYTIWRSFIGNGIENIITDSESAIVAGFQNEARNYAVFIGSGAGNIADGEYSCILGGRDGHTRGMAGKQVFSFGGNPGTHVYNGNAQAGLLILRGRTVDATTLTLLSGAGLPNTNYGRINYPVLPDNFAYAITARVIGRSTTGNILDIEIKGTVKRGSGAASTIIEGNPSYSVISRSAGASSWNVVLVANTTRGSAEINVTGAASTTINWTCKFDTVEVG